ncbi:DNA-directed RNA polymerase subunit E'' [Nanobdella aerobiophila]|uniref:Transcription elongation factor Spt4 n=1 Tax=Nanobdella aerobiophila TaxID=2586965 RepID=A0A915SG11_9ARCH|nr:transcription elongation factor subunit Spt4 [Nanobdella aerobiophila]BBL45794.1 DNA-directed RNA polymerase subunit E'' [Nanobdella aerobiophila]
MVYRKPKRKICRNCKAIINKDANKCPYCGSTDLAEDFSGFVLIVNEERSEVAKKYNFKEGKWAIKIF